MLREMVIDKASAGDVASTVTPAKFSPGKAFFSYFNSRVHGRVKFPGSRNGHTIATRWGDCRVLKEVTVERPGEKAPEAVFMARFHMKGSPEQNAKFIGLTVPFIAGLPGFRSKLWLLDEATGDFQGLYEWSTADHARAYAGYSGLLSFGFMKNRSVPGSVEYAIVDKSTGAEVAKGKL